MSDAELTSNIKAVIRGKGLVQKKVAERAGFSKCQFNDMLSGRKVIRACYIPDIATALGVEVSDLYTTFPKKEQSSQ